MKRDLPDFPGKEGLVLSVVYPPGLESPIHRHDAHSFIYVLEGSVEMQVRGGPLVRLSAGQTFYEGPTDVHLIGRNPSKVTPAKLLVVLIKRKGADVVLPAN
jgi:quercetin dioxygenase-like cupin family protein